jgi:putative DNA primase/helicase
MTSLPTAADVPSPLIDLDQWVCWREQSRGDKPTKVPVNPATSRFASTDTPETWMSFDDVRSYALDGSATGIGFVFTDHDPFVGIDLDDARDLDEESPRAWAVTIIDHLDSYTERSPSGTGYHVLIEGTLPSRPESSW